jgi:hypothetical protein
MGAMRNVMAFNIARLTARARAKTSRFAKTLFALQRAIIAHVDAATSPRDDYRCRPTSSGSSVDKAIALTGRPLARL